MVKIAIIDDEKEMRIREEECISKAVPAGCAVEFEIFSKAETFIEKLEYGEQYDMLFLDIGLPEMSGIELGRLVCGQYPEMYLIFLTSYSEFASESYRMEAYQYIEKRDMEERLPEIVKRLVSRLEREKSQYRWIGINGDSRKILYKDIIYVQKQKGAKYVEYVMKEGRYKERISLYQVCRDLEEHGFVMIERGYVVNIRHISGIGSNVVRLDNGEELTVSRARRAKVKEEINLKWGNL